MALLGILFKKCIFGILLLPVLLITTAPAQSKEDIQLVHYRQYILNSWLKVFSPTVTGCLKTDYSFDFEKWENWCRETADAGGNGIRILPYAPWNTPSGAVPIEQLFCPYKLDQMTGKWDLSRWNEEYFSTLLKMISIADRYNISIWFSLFDNCQDHHKCGHVTPWFNNVQGFNGYYASTDYSLKWIDKIVSLLGGRIKYELINEGEPRGNMELAVKWNVAMFDRLIAAGIKPENICWGTVPYCTYKERVFGQDGQHNLAQRILTVAESRNREQSNAVWRAMHGVGKANEIINKETFVASYCGEWALQWWGGIHGSKGFVSDDGVKNGNNIHDILPGGNYRRPDAAEWYVVAKEFFRNDKKKAGKWAIERLPSNIDPAIWVPTLKAIASAYHDVYGMWPENYGKYPLH